MHIYQKIFPNLSSANVYLLSVVCKEHYKRSIGAHLSPTSLGRPFFLSRRLRKKSSFWNILKKAREHHKSLLFCWSFFFFADGSETVRRWCDEILTEDRGTKGRTMASIQSLYVHQYVMHVLIRNMIEWTDGILHKVVDE